MTPDSVDLRKPSHRSARGPLKSLRVEHRGLHGLARVPWAPVTGKPAGAAVGGLEEAKRFPGGSSNTQDSQSVSGVFTD